MKKKEKQILVVGSNAAIMRDSISFFLSNNINVIGISKNPIKFKEFKKNKKFTFYKFDLNKKFNYIENLCKKINSKHPLISVIIHAQGGSFGYQNLIYDFKKWEEVWKVNFASLVIINNFFLKNFKKNNFGRILHFGSTITDIKYGPAIYSSTKSALYDYVKKMGNSFSNKNIYFNCIKTSIVSGKYNNWNKFEKKSSINSIKKILKENVSTKKFGRSEYFTPLISYLCSEKNQFITGSIISIDGGSIK